MWKAFPKSMILVLENLVPVILVMTAGWLTRISGLMSADHWSGVERLTYYILVPALLISTLASVDLSQVPVGRIGLFLLLPNLLVAMLLLALRKPLTARLGLDGAAFTSVFQGAIRWNSFVGLGLSAALFGKVGLAYCAVALAVLVPFVNCLSIMVMTRYGSAARPFVLGPFLLTLITSPFVWSSLLGLCINLVGLPIPTIILSTGDILAKATLATGLMMVGAGLEISTLQKPNGGLIVSCFVKLIVLPLLTGAFGLWLGFSGPALAVPVICASVPTAAAAYILAKQHGGDAPLMAAIMTAQTLAAAVTLPLILALFVRS